MTRLNLAIKDVEKLSLSFKEIKESIKKNKLYADSLKTNSKNYQIVLATLNDYCRFLQYIDEIEPTFFFRVRPLKSQKPFKNNKDLKYKERDSDSLGRMNNPLINTLYTSLNDQTAMFECDLKVGQIVQLAIFKTKKKIRVYKLGKFGENYFGKALNSTEQKKLFKDYLQKEKPTQSEIRGLIALENLLIELLYTDKKQETDYIIPALVADAIFKTNKERIDAIMYPSKEHKFGINVAFNEDYAKKMKVEFTEVRKIKEKYETGFMMCEEISYCKNCKEDNEWEFEKGEKIHRYY